MDQVFLMAIPDKRRGAVDNRESELTEMCTYLAAPRRYSLTCFGYTDANEHTVVQSMVI